MKHCLDCKSMTDDDAQFCPECGNKKENVKKCTSCGEEIGADSNFCSYCGALQTIGDALDDVKEEEMPQKETDKSIIDIETTIPNSKDEPHITRKVSKDDENDNIYRIASLAILFLFTLGLFLFYFYLKNNSGSESYNALVDNTSSENVIEGANNSNNPIEDSSYNIISNDDIEEEPFKIEAVDLGLSVLWANANIGANDIFEIGGYYAWGESRTKSSYTLENYFDYYEGVNDLGHFERGYRLFNEEWQSLNGTEYDVAHNLLGGNWRMPTAAEYRELRGSCKLEEKYLKDDNGRLEYVEAIGPNGNSIVFPMGGHMYESFKGRHDIYWTAETAGQNYKGPNCALATCFDALNVIDITDKYYGCNVRAVMDRGTTHTIITNGEYELYGFPLRGGYSYSNFKMTIQDSKVSGDYEVDHGSYVYFYTFEGTIDESNNMILRKMRNGESRGIIEGVFDGMVFQGKDYFEEGVSESESFRLVKDQRRFRS